MGKYKTKATQTDLGIFAHIPAYIQGIQEYSDIFRLIKHIHELPSHVQAYSEPWYIQNHVHT